MSSAYDFSFTSIDGEPLPLSSFKGKPVLVVNVASKCGLTPQYEGMEALYRDYRDKGLVVLGVPCNQFAGQEPGTEGEIKDLPEDFRVSITNAPGATSYPISSFTWLLIPAQISDAQKRDAIKDFLRWMLVDGQKYNEGLSYAQLPKSVIVKETKAISLIQ